eukprot:508127-Pelagomonas_calceolata.AAC.3
MSVSDLHGNKLSNSFQMRAACDWHIESISVHTHFKFALGVLKAFEGEARLELNSLAFYSLRREHIRQAGAHMCGGRHYQAALFNLLGSSNQGAQSRNVDDRPSSASALNCEILKEKREGKQGLCYVLRFNGAMECHRKGNIGITLTPESIQGKLYFHFFLRACWDIRKKGMHQEKLLLAPKKFKRLGLGAL